MTIITTDRFRARTIRIPVVHTLTSIPIDTWTLGTLGCLYAYAKSDAYHHMLITPEHHVAFLDDQNRVISFIEPSPVCDWTRVHQFTQDATKRVKQTGVPITVDRAHLVGTIRRLASTATRDALTLGADRDGFLRLFGGDHTPRLRITSSPRRDIAVSVDPFHLFDAALAATGQHVTLWLPTIGQPMLISGTDSSDLIQPRTLRHG